MRLDQYLLVKRASKPVTNPTDNTLAAGQHKSTLRDKLFNALLGAGVGAAATGTGYLGDYDFYSKNPIIGLKTPFPLGDSGFYIDTGYKTPVVGNVLKAGTGLTNMGIGGLVGDSIADKLNLSDGWRSTISGTGAIAYPILQRLLRAYGNYGMRNGNPMAVLPSLLLNTAAGAVAGWHLPAMKANNNENESWYLRGIKQYPSILKHEFRIGQ